MNNVQKDDGKNDGQIRVICVQKTEQQKNENSINRSINV